MIFCFSHCFSHKNVHLCHIGKDVASMGLGLVRVGGEEKESEPILVTRERKQRGKEVLV